MFKKILLLSILGVQAFCGALYAQSSTRSSLEAKLALENSLEKRVRMVLAEALGTEDVIVIISAEMQEQEKKAAELMPGIPQQEKMGEPSLSSSLTMVKKISASLILDKSVSEDDTKLARKLAAGLLGLPPDRQDLVLIEKMDFRKAKPLTLSDLFVPPNLWSLIWIVVVSLLALFTVALFLAPLSKSARAFVEAFSAHSAAQAAAAGGSAREERREEVKETAAVKAAEAQAAQPVDGRKPPFWFLGPAHLSSLAFIMKTRSVEDLTILLSYAPGDMPAKLAEALYPKSAEALAALPNVTLMPEARIRAFEAELLSSLDYVVGGEDKALGILSGLDETVQEKALAAFAKLDPAMGKKLNASIVRFSAIMDLEAAQAQALTRRVPMRVLAAALKNSPYSAPFLAKLAGGMQERLQQELDLTRDLPAEAYKGDRARVVEALRQMIKEGFISLKAAGVPRPAAAAAVKPAGLAPLPGAPAAAKPAGRAPLPATPAAAKPAALPPLPGAKPAGLPDSKPPLPAGKL
ncbi:MAG: hypothetical protein A2X32_12880 [Elusimicrobia bacterium GWC2_64_44]|nr:MAG: hypothetical protein A2X32_12880 [Elusimicrobia bacterium GWC2_64_44]